MWSFSSQQATLRRLNKAFAEFFRRVKAAKPGVKPGYPRFKGAGRFDSVEWPKDGDGARWLPEQRRVYLQGIGQVKVDLHRQVQGRVKTIQIKRQGRALDAPFQWMKQVASHFGGTRNGLAIAWPRGIKATGEQRSQFHHVIDIVPTILDAAGIEAPARVNGVEQKPIEGVSMHYSFDDAAADSRRTTQYFEIFGNRAVYHEGWIASCFHGRLPWIRAQRGTPFGDSERWELYHLADDFSQGVDVAQQYPERLAELKAVFDAEARKYDVYPLSDATLARALPANRPSLLTDRTSVTYYAGQVRIPEPVTLSYTSTSFELRAQVQIPPGGAQGVIICIGGAMGGWTLYVQDNIPAFGYNYLGHELTTVAAAEPLPEGPVALDLSFDYDGGGLGKGASESLLVNDIAVAGGRIERTDPFRFSMSGETLDVGVDTGSPVAPYGHGFRFTGRIDRIDAAVHPQPADLAAAIAEAEMRAAMGAQ